MAKTSPVSLLASLKRKVMYNIYTLVNDPNANEFAEENAQSNPDDESMSASLSSLFSTPKPETNTPTEDVIAFTSNEKINRILNRVYGIMKQCVVPFICLLLAMYVANDMIVYSIPIRVIFFVFTYAICFLFRPFMLLLVMFYAGKMMYHLYLNKLSAGAPRRMLPKIFAILPITTTKPVSALMTFLMYPFTYPKTEKDEEKLKVIMEEYMDSLKDTFPYFETVQSVPVFAEGWKQIQEWSAHLHDKPVPQEEVPSNQAPMPAVLGKPKNETPVNQAPMPAVIGKPKNETPVNQAPMPAVLGKPNNETPVNQALPAALGKPQNETPANQPLPAALGKPQNETPANQALPAALGKPKNETPVNQALPAVLGKPQNETPTNQATLRKPQGESQENKGVPLPPSLSQQAPEESKETPSK